MVVDAPSAVGEGAPVAAEGEEQVKKKRKRSRNGTRSGRKKKGAGEGEGEGGEKPAEGAEAGAAMDVQADS